jgi:hypothetical protein
MCLFFLVEFFSVSSFVPGLWQDAAACLEYFDSKAVEQQEAA